MQGSPLPLWRALVCPAFVLVTSTCLGAPTATDDSYSVPEDSPLAVSNAPLIDANFDGGGVGGAVAFDDANWDYFDEIENENGANEPYPVDGPGNAWNSVAFDPSTSTLGSWGSAPFPLQGGGIQGFPGAPEVLGGIAAAGNGQNLVTTYLFRNTFTLTAAQAAESQTGRSTSWSDDGCVIYINGVEVDRFVMPGGPVTTTTLGQFGDESSYFDRTLAVAGVLVPGVNVMAIEVHQNALDSSDAGIDLTLRAGSTAPDGFAYQDDYFGTNIPNRALGELDPSNGFNGTAALNVDVGRGNFLEGGEKSGRMGARLRPHRGGHGGDLVPLPPAELRRPGPGRVFAGDPRH